MKRLTKMILLLLLCLSVPAVAQSHGTVKTQMDSLEVLFGIHFVYDASLPLEMAAPFAVDSSQSLAQNLRRLFRDSGIDWTVQKKHVVLTQRKTPGIRRPDPVIPEALTYDQAADTLPAASITGHINRDMNFTQTGLTQLDGAAFQRAFATFSSPDVLKTLQALPGVASGTELLSNLYVQGGDGSDNLFLLDGVPLYQICHLGGIFSAFNTDAIESLDFYKSGFPARFGGRTSSVVDITTRSGDDQAYHGTFSLGLLDGRFQLEGPIVREKTSFNLALRRSWSDAVTTPVFLYQNRKRASQDNHETRRFGYSFTDLTASVTHRFSERNRLSARFYLGNDHFRLVEGNASDSGQYVSQDTLAYRLSWGNILGSLAWERDCSEEMSLRLLAYWSQSRTRIRYDNSGMSDYLVNGQYLRSQSRETLTNRGCLNDVGVTADLTWLPAPGHVLRLGGTLVRHGYSPEYAYKNTDQSTWLGRNRAYSMRDSVRASGYELGVYVEDEMSLTSLLSANVGLRNTVYATDGRVWNSLEPRLALKYQCAPGLSLKVSYARMSQFSHQLASTYIDLPTNAWLPSAGEIAPMRSNQVSAGLYARLSKALHLHLEGWWKTMDNLLEYRGMNSLFSPFSDWESNFQVGKGRSYGVEADFGYETPVVSVNAFYTLSWNERFFADSWPAWYRDRNDNRHKITLQANWRINEKWELYGAWNYHSGNRMSLATDFVWGYWYADMRERNSVSEDTFRYKDRWIYGEPNNIKIPDYHRLDIGISRHRKTRRGHESIWNFSVYNVYNRLNPFMARVRRDGLGRPLVDGFVKEPDTVSFTFSGIGLVPIIPTLSYTLKF